MIKEIYNFKRNVMRWVDGLNIKQSDLLYSLTYKHHKINIVLWKFKVDFVKIGYPLSKCIFYESIYGVCFSLKINPLLH